MQAQRGHTTHSSFAVLPGCQQPAVTQPPVMVLKDYFLEKPNGHIQKCLPGLSSGGFSTKRQKAGSLLAPQWRSAVVTGWGHWELPMSVSLALKYERRAKITVHKRRLHRKDTEQGKECTQMRASNQTESSSEGQTTDGRE